MTRRAHTTARARCPSGGARPRGGTSADVRTHVARISAKSFRKKTSAGNASLPFLAGSNVRDAHDAVQPAQWELRGPVTAA